MDMQQARKPVASRSDAQFKFYVYTMHLRTQETWHARGESRKALARGMESGMEAGKQLRE